MSFAHSSIPINNSLAWSLGNGGRGYTRIVFPFDLAWYNEQVSTKFLSFQHRKEPYGFRHEFIALRMTDGSTCRVERTGDPNARLHALTFQGSVAYDLIECFRPDRLEEARLDTSRVVAEIHLPTPLDLKDVLNICRAIQETGRTRHYTLKTFNCYFFSLALQSCLTRLVAKWEEEISYQIWKSVAEDTADSLLNIGPMIHPLFRVHSMLYASLGPGTACQEQFLTNVQRYFRESISKLLWEEIANGVYWHRELETMLDSAIKEGLLVAWWQAAISLMDRGQQAAFEPKLSDSPNDDLTSLVDKSLHALWDVAQLLPTSRNDAQVLHASRRWQSNMYNSQDAHSQSQMECRIITFDELEQVKALTFLEWLAILWYHAKQVVPQVLDLFIALSMSLLWIPAFNQHTYIDAELARIAFDLEHSDGINMNQLADLLEKLHKLRSIHRRNVAWKEFPWTQVLAAIKNRPSASSLLGNESVSIAVSLEGQAKCNIAISTFQKRYILKRIELQANLVQRVGLGSASKVSNEIQNRLSLVWATVRNDEFDAIWESGLRRRKLVEITFDGVNYAPIDLARHTDVESVRRDIIYRLLPTTGSVFDYDIFRTHPTREEAALNDPELMLDIERFGDDRGSLKFLVRIAPNSSQNTAPVLTYDMDIRPIDPPRTVRRKMLAGELGESLRRNLMWERASARFAVGAGGIRTATR